MAHASFADLLLTQQKCPAFSNGCPYASKSDPATVDKSKKCPAFSDGCPFANKSPEEVQKLIQSIPADHPHCPASAASVIAMCSDGRPLFDSLHQMRGDLFDPAVQLAAELKEGTKEIHEVGHRDPFVSRLFKQEISTFEFTAYLSKLYPVYKVMEEEMERLKDNKFVKPLYFPDHVWRAGSLEEDLEFFLGANWRNHATFLEQSNTEAVKKYSSQISKIGKANPKLLVAHMYARYLGDLSGGQMMAPKVRKGLSLPVDKGTSFFDFKNIKSPKEFKEIYRHRMNTLPLTAAEADEIVVEANDAFRLTFGIFKELAALAKDKGESKALTDEELYLHAHGHALPPGLHGHGHGHGHGNGTATAVAQKPSRNGRQCTNVNTLLIPVVIAAVLVAAAAIFWQFVVNAPSESVKTQ